MHTLEYRFSLLSLCVSVCLCLFQTGSYSVAQAGRLELTLLFAQSLELGSRVHCYTQPSRVSECACVCMLLLSYYLGIHTVNQKCLSFLHNCTET